MAPIVLRSFSGCFAPFCIEFSHGFGYQDLLHRSWRLAGYSCCCRIYGNSCKKNGNKIGGWLATLAAAGYTAKAVRRMVKTEMTDAEPMGKPSPFSNVELWSWSGVFLVSFVGALLYPAALGTSARTCLPFPLASTVLGYIVGSGIPSDVKKVFHPIICCILSADLAAFAYGYFSKSGLDPVLERMIT